MGGTLQSSAADAQRTNADAVSECLEDISIEPKRDEFGNVGVRQMTPDAEACLRQGVEQNVHMANDEPFVPLSPTDETAVYDLYNRTVDNCMSEGGYPVTWIEPGAWTVDNELYGQPQFEAVVRGCLQEAEAAEAAERAARK